MMTPIVNFAPGPNTAILQPGLGQYWPITENCLGYKSANLSYLLFKDVLMGNNNDLFLFFDNDNDLFYKIYTFEVFYIRATVTPNRSLFGPHRDTH